MYRPPTALDEAAFVAQHVGEWIAQGVSAQRIAVIFRSVRDIELYESRCSTPSATIVIFGDVNIFADRRALDALALLWNAYDPFAHEWLLRTLSGPAVGLSDASLAMLCGEPPDPRRRSLLSTTNRRQPHARAAGIQNGICDLAGT